VKAEDISLKSSQSYLIEEEKGDGCFKVFAKLVKKHKGLCISRVHPNRLKETYGIEKSNIYWLTDRESNKVSTLEYSLEKLIFTVEDFIEKNNDGVALLDGINYLINNNSFDAVLRFLRRMIDVVYETEATFIVSVSPDTLEDQELKIIEREMEIVEL
jgi:archaellum biogenesis ATPase FlaH